MIDVGLFGAGRIGKIHAGNVAKQPGVRLKYVVDVDAQAATALADRHGAKSVDADTVFGDASIGAVVIGSSTDTHADLITRAAKARKAIFCEKPVDLALDRARQCAEAVHAAGVICLIGFNRRYDPTFAAVKARIEQGEIGVPEMLVVTSRDPGAPPVDYIKRSGGIFKDMLIHDFDVFRWIMEDEAATVYATGSCLTDPGIEAAGDIDSTAVTIRTRRGLLAQINTTRRAVYGYDQRFEVLGSKGMLQARNHRPTEVMAWTSGAVSTDKPEHFFLERYRAAYAAEMAHFFDVVAGRAQPRTSIDDGVKALALAEAATTSWREKRIVEP
jgi:myo-inositol 2-dehydrogenase / D-chiro-inositol 1-dehydrogenase